MTKLKLTQNDWKWVNEAVARFRSGDTWLWNLTVRDLTKLEDWSRQIIANPFYNPRLRSEVSYETRADIAKAKAKARRTLAIIAEIQRQVEEAKKPPVSTFWGPRTLRLVK